MVSHRVLFSLGALFGAVVASLLSIPAWAQVNSPVCGITAVPPLVKVEGVAERMGDIALSCTGQPNQSIVGNLTVNLNTTITNRLLTNNKLDVALTAHTGSGTTLLATAERLGVNQAVFAGVTIPFGPSGLTELRVTNLRGDVSRMGVLQSIQATLAFNPPSLLRPNAATVVVGVPQRGLLASTQLTGVASQIGSPLPEEITFKNLIARGTRFSSTRITEGFQGAFAARGTNEDTGTRLLVRFSDYPSDARVFLPDVIVGSNGRQPTAAGDYGGTISGGEATPGTLTLVRILGTNADGAGGYSAPIPNVQPFDAVSEVALSNGSGTAVYEVIDANPAAIEFAQIPIFLGLTRTIEARTLTLNRYVSFGPISRSSESSPNQPIPRFTAVEPKNDCTSLSDCQLYLPKLEAYPAVTDFVAFSGANFQMRYLPFENVGGGVMVWSARVEFKNASDWARVYPTSGFQGNTLRLDVIPMGLAVGRYEATIVLDAGPGGVARYPVTLEVKAAPPPQIPAPVISSVGGAATFSGPLTPGGIATLKGSNFSGPNVSVTFDGKTARVLFTNVEQINVQVPSELTGPKTTIAVTANGVASGAFSADLAPLAPGIFPGGIFNQDSTVNTAGSPAQSPSVIQIYTTGLLPPDGQARVEVKLHDDFYSGAALLYAGPAPGIPGVQQVNLQIRSGYPTMTTDLQVCATVGNAQRICSPAARISLRGE
ncbi:MAG TPA: IPT/TIG domain-containing protein [Bryobacteraceae bacterium]|nr:IPT/TIG domain-containing protein [Bryobacteraceae bacterium]